MGLLTPSLLSRGLTCRGWELTAALGPMVGSGAGEDRNYHFSNVQNLRKLSQGLTEKILLLSPF